VSKKTTCRIWAANGSMPSAATVDRRAVFGTVSLSSTLSAWRTWTISSPSCSADSAGIACSAVDSAMATSLYPTVVPLGRGHTTLGG
jgi:hypothetical protein